MGRLIDCWIQLQETARFFQRPCGGTRKADGTRGREPDITKHLISIKYFSSLFTAKPGRFPVVYLLISD